MISDQATYRCPVALAGANLTYFRGLKAALDPHGWDLVHTRDPQGWAAEAGERMLLVVLARAEHDDVIRQLPRRDTLTVLALIPDPIAEDIVTLTRAGATAVTDADADPDHITLVLQQLAAGYTLIPLVAQQRLVAIARSETHQPVLADDEVKWLRLLSQGRNAPDIAAIEHRSVRSIQRALTALYQRIEVEGRPQAIAWAARHDLLG